LPPFLDQLSTRRWPEKPEDRYAHASEFADDLKRFLAMGSAQQAGVTAQDAEKTIVTLGGAQSSV